MLEEARRAAEGHLAMVDRETGEPPKESRLQSASALRQMWHELCNADRTGSYNRSLVRQLRDGHPPFDQNERAEEGQEDLFNVNTGHGRLILDEGTSAFMEIFNSERNLTKIPLSRKIPAKQRFDWQRVIENRWTEMLKSWDLFMPRMNNLCSMIVIDGVGAMFYDSEDTWHPYPASLAEVKFPRWCEPVSTAIPLCLIKKNVHVGTLFRKVSNERSAKKYGWDKAQVLKAIHNSGKKAQDRWKNFEKFEEDLKANEAYVSTECEPVEVVYGLIEEFDGRVSSFAAALDGGVDDDSKTDFLQKRLSIYKNQNEAFQVFPYETGSNNRLYTIRGLGHFIYQPANAENIMWSNLMNAARVAGFPQYQVRGNEEMEDASIVDMGYGLLLPPGVEIPEKPHNRDLKQSILPALEVINTTLRQNSGALADGPLGLGERANESNIAVSLEQINKMNSFAIALVYPPLDRMYKEMVRRVFFAGKDTDESLRMKKLLVEEDGVPEGVLKMIDLPGVCAYRVMSGGDKANRINRLRLLRNEMYGAYDAQGRAELDYDYTLEWAGRDYAERYKGPIGQTRTTRDEEVAEFENFMLTEGEEVEPKDGQDHFVHLQQHLEPMIATYDAVENGEAELADYVLENLPLWSHSQKQFDMWQPDRIFQEQYNEIKAQLQRLREFFWNGLRQINEGEGQQNAQAGEGELSEEQKKDIAFMKDERRKDMKAMNEEQRRDAAAMAQIERDRAIADAKSATEIRNK